MKYVSIDIETTGLNPETCDVLEIAAVVEDTNHPEVPVHELPWFHCYVDKHSYQGEPYALSMHGEIFRRIAKREKPHAYLLPEDAVTQLFVFLNRTLGIEKNFPAAGKNFSNLDKPFLHRLTKSASQILSFHHRVIDPAMFYWNPTEDVELPSSKVCLERSGVGGGVAHTALADAQMVIHLVRSHQAKLSSSGYLLETHT